MKTTVIYLASAVFLLVAVNCTRPLGVQDRGNSNSGLSSLGIKFSNNIDPQLKAYLSSYQLSAEAQDESCKKKKVETISEQVDLKSDSDLKIEKKVTRNCEYLIKLAFGEKIEGKFVGYFSNYLNRDGDIVKTDAAEVQAQIKLAITEDGLAKNLDKYLKELSTEENSNLELDITFEGVKLEGEFLAVCVSSGDENAVFRNRLISIGNGQIEINERLYRDASCDATEEIYHVSGLANYNLSKRESGDGANLDLSNISKTFEPGPAISALSNISSDLSDSGSENYKKSIGSIAAFDLVNLKSNTLTFGRKDSGRNGYDSSSRPDYFDLTNYGSLDRK